MKRIIILSFVFLSSLSYGQDYNFELEGGVILEPKKIYERSKAEVYTYTSYDAEASTFNQTIEGDFVIAIYSGWVVLWMNHNNSFVSYLINDTKEHTGATVYILWQMSNLEHRHQLIIENSGIIDLYMDLKSSQSENRFIFTN